MFSLVPALAPHCVGALYTEAPEIVDDLTELLAKLREAGVEIHNGPESHENGKFAWIADPDGNKVELWEPMLWDDKNKA